MAVCFACQAGLSSPQAPLCQLWRPGLHMATSFCSQLIGLQQLACFSATRSLCRSMTPATMSSGTMHVAVPVQHSGAAKGRGTQAV